MTKEELREDKCKSCAFAWFCLCDNELAKTRMSECGGKLYTAINKC